MALKQPRIRECLYCGRDISLFRTNRGVCPVCRDAAVRKAVEQGYIDYRHTAERIVEAMAERAVVLLDGCDTVTDAHFFMHAAEDHDGNRFQHPVIYAVVKVGFGHIKVTIREDHILDILAQDLDLTSR